MLFRTPSLRDKEHQAACTCSITPYPPPLPRLNTLQTDPPFRYCFWVAFCGPRTCFTRSWVVLHINLGRAKDPFKKLMNAIDPFPRNCTRLSFIHTQFQKAGYWGPSQPLQFLMLGHSFLSPLPLPPYQRQR